MNKRILVIWISIILSQYSFSQTLKVESLTRFTKSGKPLRYEFPLLKCGDCDYSTGKINAAISIDLLDLDIQDSLYFYSNIQPDIDSPIPLIRDLSYKINLLTNRFYSVTFILESCSAYCESDERSYNYDFMKNDFIQLKEIFKPNGLTKFSAHLEANKKNRLNQHFAQKKDSITDPEKYDAHQLMEGLYRGCYKNASYDLEIAYLDFVYKENTLIVFSESCSNHALSGLDKIGKFVSNIKLVEWMDYLSEYGKSLIVKK